MAVDYARGMTRDAPSVWERSRRLAGQEILDTAVRLFTTQGYDETTTSQIAQEAGVSQRTLFRYFGTKEDLVFSEGAALGELMKRTVDTQPADVSAWTALRNGFAATFAATHSPEQTLVLSALTFRTPSLHAGYVQRRLLWQIDLMPSIRTRLHAAGREGLAADHEARTVIAVSFACADAATATWAASGGTADAFKLYDESIALVRAST